MTDVNEFAPEFLPAQPSAFPPSVAGVVMLLNESFYTSGAPIGGHAGSAASGSGSGAGPGAGTAGPAVSYAVRVRENWLEPSTEVLRVRASDRDDSHPDADAERATGAAARGGGGQQPRLGPTAVRYSFADTEFHVSSFAHDSGAVLSDRFRIDEQTGEQILSFFFLSFSVPHVLTASKYCTVLYVCTLTLHTFLLSCAFMYSDLKILEYSRASDLLVH